MRFQFAAAFALTGGALVGCASTPDVTVSFYFPKAETRIQVVQTVACNAEKTDFVSTVAVTPTTAYSSDRTVPKGKLRLKDLSGAISDSDVTVNFTDDGRLAGVNAVSTGQGGTIVQSALSIAALMGLSTVKLDGKAKADHLKRVSQACADIKSFAGDKPVSVTYTAVIPYDRPVFSAVLVPDAGSASIYDKLHAIFPEFELHVAMKMASETAEGASFPKEAAGSDVVLLELNRVSWASVSLFGPESNFEKRTQLWQAEIAVPLGGEHYFLPIPRAALLGKETFGLSLSAYGSVQKIQYAKNSGASDALASFNALTKAVEGPSVADQAAALKAQADLIAQQQRLVGCQTKPADCK